MVALHLSAGTIKLLRMFVIAIPMKFIIESGPHALQPLFGNLISCIPLKDCRDSIPRLNFFKYEGAVPIPKQANELSFFLLFYNLKKDIFHSAFSFSDQDQTCWAILDLNPDLEQSFGFEWNLII
jgi:hypothetical protein